MSLYITSAQGIVHGGDNPCRVAVEAQRLNRHRSVRLSQVIVYKLPYCPVCFNAHTWDSVLSARTPVAS